MTDKWKVGVDGLARHQSVPMTDKNEACKQAWERYAVFAAYSPSEASLGYDDFQAGFEAGYTAGLQSTAVEAPIAKASLERATVQSELERRLGVKLAANGWRIELAGNGEHYLVCHVHTIVWTSDTLSHALQFGDLAVTDIIGRYRIL